MAKTLLLVVGSIPVEIKVQSTEHVSTVYIQEDFSVVGSPTTGFKVYAPDLSAAPIQKGPGASFCFGEQAGSRSSGYLYQPRQVLGYIVALTGSTTFQQVEQP